MPDNDSRVVSDQLGNQETFARWMATNAVLGEVGDERIRQFDKHGDQTHLTNGTGGEWYQSMASDFKAMIAWKITPENAGGDPLTFTDILLEEVFEALAERDTAKLRAELIQVAAVAVQWAEAISKQEAAGA